VGTEAGLVKRLQEELQAAMKDAETHQQEGLPAACASRELRAGFAVEEAAMIERAVLEEAIAANA